MSYVIQIIAGTIPSDDKQAWDIMPKFVEADRASARPISPPLSRLHDLLVTEYPCITEDPDSVWSDDPLIRNFGHEQAVIGFINPTEVMPFIIKTANSLGLTVFDDQEGKIYRAGTSHEIIENPPQVLKKKDALNLVCKELNPIMQEQGFKLIKAQQTFRRIIEGGFQEIGIPLTCYAPEYYFSLVFTVRIDLVSNIINHFGVKDSLKYPSITLLVQLSRFLPDTGNHRGFEFRNQSEIQTHVNYLKPVFSNQIFPFLNRVRDLHSVADVYDFQILDVDGLTVAWLANRRPEETARLCEERWKELKATHPNHPFYDEKLKNVRSLIEFLRFNYFQG